MYSKKIDVLIYFEHISRELDSCFMLKYQLDRVGISSKVLPIHRNRYLNIIKYKPKMIIVPFLFADKIDRLLADFNDCYGEVQCLNLHHEQFYNDMTKSHFMPKNKMARSVYHLSWTKSFADDLIENGVEENKILILGNARTDNFYIKPSKKVLDFKNGYNKLIFIPTSFSWAFVEEDYFLIKAKLDPIKFRKQKDLTLKTIDIFFRSIREIASSHEDMIFVLRPHPFEDIDKYTASLKSVCEAPLEKNIRIIREGNVYDWLAISDLVIGWITTVSMEATLFNRKNIIFQPVKLDSEMQTEFITKYDEIIDNKNKLEQIIENIDNYEPNNLNLKQYVTKAFGCADGNVNMRIAVDVKNIISSSDFNPNNSSKLLNNFFKAFRIDFFKNIFIRLNLLPIYNSMYSGLMEDLVSTKVLNNKYEEFKKRLIK